MLEQGRRIIQKIRRALRWAWRHLERLALLGVLFWVVARWLAVRSYLTSYEVDDRIFLAIDIISAFPYVWGLAGVIRTMIGGAWLSFTVRATVALLSFLSPYVYLWWAGKDKMPAKVKWAIVIFCALLALKAVHGVYVQHKRLAHQSHNS